MKLKIALALFSAAELQELGQALDAQLLGNQPSLADCFRACLRLMKENPDWGETHLSLLLFPDNLPRDKLKYLRTRTTALMRKIEQFLAWKAMQKDHVLQDYCLVAELRRRDWNHEYRRTYAQALHAAQHAPLRGFGHYATLFTDFNETAKIADLEPHQRPNLDLQPAIDALDKAYMLKKLSMACNAASFDREYQTKHAIYDIPDDPAWQANPRFRDEPLLHLFYLLLKITRDVSPDADPTYHLVKDLLFKHAADLAQSNLSEAQNAMTHLINYCSIRINQKAAQFQAELAAVYQTAITTQILLVEGKISSLDFINAFTAFLIANDGAAAQWLLDTYTSEIYGEAGLATKHYCKGYQQLREGRNEAAAAALMAAYHSPPKNKWPPLEATIIAQLARAKYLIGEYPEAEYFASILIGRIAEKGRLDQQKTLAFSIYARRLLQLCQARRLTGRRQQRIVEALQKKQSTDTMPYYASTWMAAQIRGL